MFLRLGLKEKHFFFEIFLISVPLGTRTIIPPAMAILADGVGRGR